MGNRAVSINVLDVLSSWFHRRQPTYGALGISASITLGSEDRVPRSAWLDFETEERSARLIVWSNGQAELTVGDLVGRTILLDEHREIETEVGLNDAERTILSLMS